MNELLLDPEPITIAEIINRLIPDYLLLTPEDRLLVVKKTFPDNHEVLHNKLEAWVTINVCDNPFNNWWAFEKCTQALNGNIPDFFVSEPATPAQCAYSLLMMKKSSLGIQPSEEIHCYIAASAADKGYLTLPRSLEKADKILPELLSDLGRDLRTQVLKGEAPQAIMQEQNRKLAIIEEYLRIKLNKLLVERKELLGGKNSRGT